MLKVSNLFNYCKTTIGNLQRLKEFAVICIDAESISCAVYCGKDLASPPKCLAMASCVMEGYFIGNLYSFQLAAKSITKVVDEVEECLGRRLHSIYLTFISFNTKLQPVFLSSHNKERFQSLNHLNNQLTSYFLTNTFAKNSLLPNYKDEASSEKPANNTPLLDSILDFASKTDPLNKLLKKEDPNYDALWCNYGLLRGFADIFYNLNLDIAGVLHAPYLLYLYAKKYLDSQPILLLAKDYALFTDVVNSLYEVVPLGTCQVLHSVAKFTKVPIEVLKNGHKILVKNWSSKDKSTGLLQLNGFVIENAKHVYHEALHSYLQAIEHFIFSRNTKPNDIIIVSEYLDMLHEKNPNNMPNILRGVFVMSLYKDNHYFNNPASITEVLNRWGANYLHTDVNDNLGLNTFKRRLQKNIYR